MPGQLSTHMGVVAQRQIGRIPSVEKDTFANRKREGKRKRESKKPQEEEDQMSQAAA